MGPPAEHPRLHAAGGVDHAVDQVRRLAVFRERHPDVMITSPGQNGTREFKANWLEPQPGGDSEPREAAHDRLGPLLDYLEARFDR